MVIEKIVVPDFGDVQTITVVDIYISVGDEIKVDDSLISLESEKAVMDIPSPFAGTITEILVKEDEKTTSGALIALVETVVEDSKRVATEQKNEEISVEKRPPADSESGGKATIHATPSVRAYARAHDIDLATVVGTGPNGRILLEDMQSTGQQSPGLDLVPALDDFSKDGEVEEVALGRIQKISAAHLLRSWQQIPHVSHFDEADISELTKFRQELNGEFKKGQDRLTILVFIMKAVATVLKGFPRFNSSMAADGEKILLKKYYHIGIAVDTSAGLVVPVIRDVDKKGIRLLNAELKQLSSKAREGKLAITELKGATFTISSLGGIGGTGFTPIINWPQVAILGLSRSYEKPVWHGDGFIPRLTLPFSVSYDHRVIDGAEAARFCRAVAAHVKDLKRILL